MAIASYGSAASRSYARERPRWRSRRAEQDDEHILELREKPATRHRRFGGQLVAAVALEPRCGLTVGQATPTVRSERGEDPLKRLLIGRDLNRLQRRRTHLVNPFIPSDGNRSISTR